MDLQIAAGTFVCVLGTNGVGKTLTLHTLAGLRPPAAGEVTLDGEELGKLSRKSVAQRLGLLLQIHDDAFPLTVMDSALMGRYPHAGIWRWPDDNDREQVRKALHVFDLDGIEDRIIGSLSGGERERVALATLMVQDPAIWLLDEPTNHLDPHHQLTVLDTLRDMARRDRTLFATIHNPALALRYADTVLMLYGDGAWEYGPASALLEPGRLERMYRTPFDYYSSATGEHRTLLPA